MVSPCQNFKRFPVSEILFCFVLEFISLSEPKTQQQQGPFCFLCNTFGSLVVCICFLFKKIFRNRFLLFGTLMQTFCSVFDNKIWAICLYRSICFDRKKTMDDNNSLNYRLGIIFKTICICFQPVVMTDASMEILTSTNSVCTHCESVLR